jgi:restriction system protein
MWPTVKALREMGGSGQNAEISTNVTRIENLSEEQQSEPHPGRSSQTELEYRLAWARTYLSKIGALKNSARGVWTLTEQGREITEEEVGAGHDRVQAQLRESRRAVKKSGSQPERQDQFEADYMESDESSDPERTWRDELLDVLKDMAPDAFERLTQRLLREAGFRNVEVLGRSGDGGIDGVGIYRVSLVSFPTYFQCKRYQGAVPPKEVRDFRGALVGRGEKGLLITTGTFTSSAKKEANRDGAPPVDLVDGDELCELLKQYEMGVTTRTVEESTIAKEFFEQF